METERQIFMHDLLAEGHPFFATYESGDYVSFALTWRKDAQQSAGFFFDAGGSALCGTVMGHPTPDIVQGLVEAGKGKGYG